MNRESNIEELLAYAAGELAGERARLVEARLAAEPGALALVERYRAVLRLVKTDDSVAPTARAMASATALFEAQSKQPARSTQREARRLTWLERFDALIADLIFDSRLQPLAVRRVPTADIVQLAYQAEGFEIELRASWTDREREDSGVQSTGGTWRIIGQACPHPAGQGVSGERADSSGGDLRAKVALVTAGDDVAVAEADCDETGMFAIEAPPTGGAAYDLCLRMPDGKTIVVPGIELP